MEVARARQQPAEEVAVVHQAAGNQVQGVRQQDLDSRAYRRWGRGGLARGGVARATPRREAEREAEKQRAIDGAAERLRAAEAEYQAELARRSER